MMIREDYKGLITILQSEHNMHVAEHEQIAQLKRLIEEEEENHRTSGYKFEPDIKTSTLKRIFNFEDAPLPFEPTTNDDLADAGVDTYAD